jgi:hypothetical protein
MLKGQTMPQGQTISDLSSQIETLYRVISQIRPSSEPGAGRGGQLPPPVARPAGNHSTAARGARVRWIFKFYCLWFSLPLSVWFSSGCIGLLFYWRALSCTARLVEFLHRLLDRFPHMPSLLLRTAKFRKGGAPCSAIELEAQ